MVDRSKKVVYTKHLPQRGTPEEDLSATVAGRITPEDLTDQEKEEIKKGNLGYCEAHRVLYKKWALSSCVIPSISEQETRADCKEWPMDPDYTEIH